MFPKLPENIKQNLNSHPDEKLYGGCLYQSALDLVDHLTALEIKHCIIKMNNMGGHLDRLDEYYVTAYNNILVRYENSPEEKKYLDDIKKYIEGKIKEKANKGSDRELEEINSIAEIQKKYRNELHKGFLKLEIERLNRVKAIQYLSRRNKIRYFLFRILIQDLERDLFLAEKQFFLENIINITKKKFSTFQEDVLQRTCFPDQTEKRNEICREFYNKDQKEFALSWNLISEFQLLYAPYNELSIDRMAEEVKNNFDGYFKSLNHSERTREDNIQLSSETLIRENLDREWRSELQKIGGIKEQAFKKMRWAGFLLDNLKHIQKHKKDSELHEMIACIDKCVPKDWIQLSEFAKQTAKEAFDWKTAAFIGAGVALGLIAVGLFFWTGGLSLFLLHFHIIHAAVLITKLGFVVGGVVLGGGLGFGTRKVAETECAKAEINKLSVVCGINEEDTLGVRGGSTFKAGIGLEERVLSRKADPVIPSGVEGSHSVGRASRKSSYSISRSLDSARDDTITLGMTR